MSSLSVLRSVIAAARLLVGLAGTLAAIAYGALFALEFAHLPRVEHAVPVVVGKALAPSIVAVSDWFGWHWPRTAGTNYAPAILAIAVLVARGFLDNVLARIAYRLGRTTPKRRLLAESPMATGSLGRYTGSVATEQQRAAMLKRYRDIEESLRSSERKTCTFVSIDVVGSTKMKIDERPTAIAATFQAYDELVRSAFDAHGVWKSTWTPDGVMACFLDRNLALRAAQHILGALERFNAAENQLRTPFACRCGMNEGDVAIFEDSALEKVSDHAIDIAGHMQKYADENQLLMSDVLYRALASPEGFVATGREVDGFPTYGWTPRLAEQPAAEAEPASR